MSGNNVVHAEPVMAVPVESEGGVGRGQAAKSSPGSSNQWPVNGSQEWNQTMEQNVYEMGGDVNGGDGQGNWADDTIERSGNLFGQLDSMIAAVQNESSALDSMREKLRELDGMRGQLSSLTKRLLEADQANLTLKSNLVKIQEAYADLRRQKQELESTMVPLRQELNKTKDTYSKERMARLSAQQETSMLKDQLLRLEKINEDLERDVKSIPALADSNELLKADLTRIRNRYKEEKASLTNSNNALMESNRDLEAGKAEIRGLAVRLLDLASQSSKGASQRNLSATNASGSKVSAGGGGDRRQPAHQQAMQWEQQQQQQFQQFQLMQQQMQQQQQRQQHPQQMMTSQSQSNMHLQGAVGGSGGTGLQGYGQYQPTYPDSTKNSPSSVNDGRGLTDVDQPWLSQTLEEHMLGTSHQTVASPVPGYYGGGGASIGDDHSVETQHTKNSQHTHHSHNTQQSHQSHHQPQQQPQHGGGGPISESPKPNPQVRHR